MKLEVMRWMNIKDNYFLPLNIEDENEEVINAIIDDIRKNNYKFTALDPEEDNYFVPVLNNYRYVDMSRKNFATLLAIANNENGEDDYKKYLDTNYIPKKDKVYPDESLRGFESIFEFISMDKEIVDYIIDSIEEDLFYIPLTINGDKKYRHAEYLLVDNNELSIPLRIERLIYFKNLDDFNKPSNLEKIDEISFKRSLLNDIDTSHPFMIIGVYVEPSNFLAVLKNITNILKDYGEVTYESEFIFPDKILINRDASLFKGILEVQIREVDEEKFNVRVASNLGEIESLSLELYEAINTFNLKIHGVKVTVVENFDGKKELHATYDTINCLGFKQLYSTLEKMMDDMSDLYFELSYQELVPFLIKK